MRLFRLRRKGRVLPREPVIHHSVVTWEQDHVRAAVVELAEGAANLVGVGAAPVHGVGRTSHPDLDRWIVGCDRALSQAEDMTPRSCRRKLVPDYVTMSIPAEVARSLPLTVSRERRNARSGVTYQELRALIQRGYRKAQDIEHAHSGEVTEDFVYGSVAEISLDDQVAVEPFGLRGEHLGLRMDFYLAPLEWIRALEIISERLQLTLTAIVPQHAACASPLPDPASLLILLDRHHTVISKVRRGRLEWSTLVELGERHIIGATAEMLGLHRRQAGILMGDYRRGQLQPDDELQVARAFWAGLCGWMEAIAESVTPIAQNGTVPYKVYFNDVTKHFPEALPSLETPYWEGCLPFARCPEVIALKVSSVRDVLDCTAQAGGPAYLPLRALAHLVARLYAPGKNLDRAVIEAMRWRRRA